MKDRVVIGLRLGFKVRLGLKSVSGEDVHNGNFWGQVSEGGGKCPKFLILRVGGLAQRNWQRPPAAWVSSSSARSTASATPAGLLHAYLLTCLLSGTVYSRRRQAMIVL